MLQEGRKLRTRSPATEAAQWLPRLLNGRSNVMEIARHLSRTRRWGAAVAGLSLASLIFTSGPASGVKVPALTPKSFTPSFAAMSQLKALVKAGKGLVGVILPHATSSGRDVTDDAPYLDTACQKARY